MDEHIADEYQRNLGDKVKNFISNIGLGTILVLGAIIGILIFMTTRKNLDPRYHWVVYFILGGIIIYLWFKSSPEKKLIPRKVAVKIAQEELDYMVKTGREFKHDSIVKVTEYSHLRTKDNLTDGFFDFVAWDIGYEELIQGSQFKKEGVISIHPYKGIVIGIEGAPMGWDARESRDVKIVPVGVIMGTQKTTDMAGLPPPSK